MFAIGQAKSTTDVNLLTMKLGYFLVKSVGMLFLSKRNIVMAERENLKICKAKDQDTQKLKEKLRVLYQNELNNLRAYLQYYFLRTA